MFVGNVQTIRKRVKNKQSKKKYKKNERKKIEWKSENSKKKKEKRKSSEKEGGGVARILFFNWVIYDPSDDLRSYSDDDCFVFTVRKKTTRSSWFFFFFCSPLSFPSFAFFSCFSQSVCFFSTIFFATYYSSSDKQRVILLRLGFFFRVYTCIRFLLWRFFVFPFFFFFFLRAADSEKKIPQGRRKY